MAIDGLPVTTICVADNLSFTKDEEKDSIVIKLDGKIRKGRIGVAAKCSGDGTLEVECHGSHDGVNWSNEDQAHSAVASDGAWDYDVVDWTAKSFAFLKIAMLENDVNALTGTYVFVTIT